MSKNKKMSLTAGLKAEGRREKREACSQALASGMFRTSTEYWKTIWSYQEKAKKFRGIPVIVAPMENYGEWKNGMIFLSAEIHQGFLSNDMSKVALSWAILMHEWGHAMTAHEYEAGSEAEIAATEAALALLDAHYSEKGWAGLCQNILLQKLNIDKQEHEQEMLQLEALAKVAEAALQSGDFLTVEEFLNAGEEK